MSAQNKSLNGVDINSVWREYLSSKELLYRNQLIDYYLEDTRILSAKLYSARLSDIADFSDYLHYGIIGLIDSIDRFNPSFGAKFFTFASYRIKGSIYNGISTMGEYTASTSNELIFRSRITQFNDHYDEREDGDLFDSLVDTSVMLAIGIMLDDVEQSSEQYRSQSFLQLKESLNSYIDILDSNERVIIQYHYFHQFQFSTIAEILGLTKSRVSQLHKKALMTLRNKCSSTLELEL